jgi:hypothetical protein
VSEYQDVIRDGLPVHFIQMPPRYQTAQRDIKDPIIKAQVVEKLQKVRDRRYIAPGPVTSLTMFFQVLKGLFDIRMVYDGSGSGLNDCIWVPRFALPTIRTHMRAVCSGTHMTDVDLGEFFLNFVLHPTLKPLAGVDFTKYFPHEDGGKVWEAWCRAAMGLKSSPYQAVQGMAYAEEFIRGDRRDCANVFRWDIIILNLPGSEEYDPSLPWVYKCRSSDGKVAVDVFGFVDDFRQTGNTSKEAWLAARQVASRSNFLGIQDAPRKTRDGGTTPGAWTGSFVRTSDDGVFLLISEEKWNKTKAQLAEVLDMIDVESGKLNRKRLEQIRGFLNYVAQTYDWLTPYMIGLHMTIDGWRPGRELEGWKVKPLPQVTFENSGEDDEGDWVAVESYPSQPDQVKAVPRLRSDIVAMLELCKSQKPPPRRVRARVQGRAYYGFGDASKTGFGASIQIGKEIQYQYGQWTSEASESTSSNWKELSNLVDSLDEILTNNDLRGCEMFMFTDNSTAEAAYWKGTSHSQKLFDLVLRLKKLEAKHDMILHVIHVSGKRMIAQGTDGISRGDHSAGVMRGIPMTAYVPLHIDAFTREPKLREFIEEIGKDLAPTFLEPEGWFDDGHKRGNFIWSPAPAAAEVVVEQLGRARLKRPQSLHIVVVPRLMTGRWRRHLSRGTDFYLKIDWNDLWPLATHHEPVLMFVCLPYESHRPNFRRVNELLDRFRGTMLKDSLSEISSRGRRDFLCQLLVDSRALCSL